MRKRGVIAQLIFYAAETEIARGPDDAPDKNVEADTIAAIRISPIIKNRAPDRNSNIDWRLLGAEVP